MQRRAKYYHGGDNAPRPPRDPDDAYDTLDYSSRAPSAPLTAYNPLAVRRPREAPPTKLPPIPPRPQPAPPRTARAAPPAPRREPGSELEKVRQQMTAMKRQSAGKKLWDNFELKMFKKRWDELKAREDALAPSK